MTYSLTFLAQNCIDCNLCNHVCLPDAITLNHEPTYEQVFSVKEPHVVGSGSLVRCERCKSLMAARDSVKLCSLCEYRRTHPFGSMMPKKVIKEIPLMILDVTKSRLCPKSKTLSLREYANIYVQIYQDFMEQVEGDGS